ncbi:DUF5666 domain-containing protein [Methylobacterium brachiatum]|uniref:DUF5666 domain-containing protein n=1 Tax=Methylobacterium brachiatum TaxID=269660 RepID=UPI00244C52F7|nr:DUF5666 domain-containing protein [Methylobacterium brachiatum]MDH2309101.1 DUF5666 domain-containing protein [Methylobacterium brachiatum]
MRSFPNRRFVLRLLAGAATLRPGIARPQESLPDQGIGGTGMKMTDEPKDGPLGEGDRGIGGTGVIGTIRRFGSIIVNDLRIAYPSEVEVRIDGEPAKAADLKIGQVVQVVARPERGGLGTSRIDVTSEVVGRVDSVAPGQIIVLGQRVATTGLTGDWQAGTRVAVSGLRRPDGVIVASLIEPRNFGPDRVAGPVRRDADGGLAIGDLRLKGADALPPGRRAMVTGVTEPGLLDVTNTPEVGLPFPPGLRRVSIEAYIGRADAGAGLDLGSGLVVSGYAGLRVPRQGSVHGVLTADIAPDGGLTLERLRVDDRIPTEPSRQPGSPRFERERDRLDLQKLPDLPEMPRERPGRLGAEPGRGRSPFGGLGDSHGPTIDTRPGAGSITGTDGPGGFGPPRGFGGPPGGPGPGAPGSGFGGPGGFGGPPGGGGRR